MIEIKFGERMLVYVRRWVAFVVAIAVLVMTAWGVAAICYFFFK